MNIKKIGSGLVVALSMLAFNAAAQAVCTDEIDYIQQAADNLRCTQLQSPEFGDADGLWNHEPIWQKAAGKGKGKKSDVPGDGCEVHQKLARLLYEERDPDRDSPPPKKKGNNVARGAAHALADGQFQYAIELLAELKASIEISVVNPDPDWGEVIDTTNGDFPGDAQYWADVYWKFADDTQRAIDDVNMVCYSDINP